MLYKTYYSSPIGTLLLVSDEKNLLGLWIKNSKYYLANIKEPIIEKETKILLKTKDWLDCYFKKENPKIKELPLKPTGTLFQQEVWSLLCEIPYGTTTTYKDIAGKIAKNKNKHTFSCQAVGSAIGHNPISIIIPCHRVIGSNGKLTGYAGGIDKKLTLLKLEQKENKK